ncbi:MAG: hypothetical protein ACK4MV_01135 [Beijerinckiaceae bacterium]
MAIEKQTYLYEVLVRGSRDGSISGAHQIRNEALVDTQTGEVLNERQGLAVALAVEDVRDLLGESFATAAAQIVALQAQVTELANARNAPEANRADIQAPVAALVISDRQFAQGLAARGLITRDEALAFVQKGELPRLLADFLETIADEAKRFEAALLLTGAKEFRRDHPLSLAIAGWAGLDAKSFDEFWAQCGAL